MRKGSITIFVCLVMTVMISLLLGCIFSVQVRAGRAQLVNGMDQALFSLLGRYDRQMLEKFDVFFLDGGCGTKNLQPDKLCERVEDDLAFVVDPGRGRWPFSGKSLFELRIENCNLTGYTLATDAGGRIFRDAALRYEKETFSIQAAETAVTWLRSVKTLTDAQAEAAQSISAAAASGDPEQAAAAAESYEDRLEKAAQSAAEAQLAAGGRILSNASGGETGFGAMAGRAEDRALETLGPGTGDGLYAGTKEPEAGTPAGTLTFQMKGETAVMEEPEAGALTHMTLDMEELAPALGLLILTSGEEAFAMEELAGDAPGIPAGLSEAMPALDQILSSPILSLTLTEETGSQWRSVRTEELYSHRGHSQGVGVIEIPGSGESLNEAFLYNEYLLRHLGNRKEVQEDAALYCPAEYLIAGEDSDTANVESVIKRILVFREGVNLAHLFQDPAKNSYLKAAASALALIVMQPESEKAFEAALGAAWAYAESVVDVRGLFLGKRNCLLKDAAHWQVNLTDLPAFFSGNLDRLVKGADAGLAYLDYLRMLLLFEDGNTVLSRSLDMVEICARGIERHDFRLDNCLSNVTFWVDALAERRVELCCERSLGYREL